MRAFRLSALLLLILVVAGGWGFLVHRTTTQLAVYQLPLPMQSFFHENMDYLVRHSVRPDQRRNGDPTEGPKHFIDLEAFEHGEGGKLLPEQWAEAVKLFPEDSLKKYGYVPYWVVTMKERLTEAFQSGNRDSILFYAADIAHYIEDAHVPLHTTLNHDGQRTGQKGMHSLWESMVPEIELTNYQLFEEHNATYISDPAKAIWGSVRHAHTLLPDLFAAEKEVSQGFVDSTKYRIQMRNGRESKSYSSAFARAYAQRLGNTVNSQLLRSTHMVTDFWYTAWVDAGKPDLSKLLKAPLTAEQRFAFEKELRSFKSNNLIQDKLLRAREEKKEAGSGD
ncbi:zinc dependent phospholipase C family protein [Flaviaesturariibacter amylovorans]|uniref:S1/P1 Nuclease n=1 Tax=Flaviaesturariibacter amylovorans TaxID=1084520 RepID=A0ABP8HS42_9BACT